LCIHGSNHLATAFGSNANYHHISATPISGKVRHFARDHVRAFVMSIFIHFGEGSVFILYALHNATKFPAKFGIA
jgi:hypothetical protein